MPVINKDLPKKRDVSLAVKLFWRKKNKKNIAGKAEGSAPDLLPGSVNQAEDLHVLLFQLEFASSIRLF